MYNPRVQYYVINIFHFGRRSLYTLYTLYTLIAICTPFQFLQIEASLIKGPIYRTWQKVRGYLVIEITDERLSLIKVDFDLVLVKIYCDVCLKRVRLLKSVRTESR